MDAPKHAEPRALRVRLGSAPTYRYPIALDPASISSQGGIGRLMLQQCNPLSKQSDLSRSRILPCSPLDLKLGSKSLKLGSKSL
jgi:hypothetical protein